MWEFKREEQQFEQIPVGSYRIRVNNAEMAVSNTGNNMVVVTFDVSGQTQTLRHYIPFLKDNPSVTNRMLTAFYDSFKDIKEGENDLKKWVGKVGACVVKHETYEGSPRARISYFIKADKQSDLPAWKEPNSQESSSNPTAEIPDIGDSNLPF